MPGTAVETPRLPFKGRKTVESYDPATWPYPREEAAEREWDEDEAEERRAPPPEEPRSD